MYTKSGLTSPLGGDILLVLEPLGGDILLDALFGLVSCFVCAGLYTNLVGFEVLALAPDRPLFNALGACSLLLTALEGGGLASLESPVGGVGGFCSVSFIGGGDSEPLELASLGRLPLADSLRNLLPSDLDDSALDLEVMLEWLVLMLPF